MDTYKKGKKGKKGKNDYSYNLAPDNEQGMNHSPYNTDDRRKQIAELSEQVLKEMEHEQCKYNRKPCKGCVLQVYNIG